MRAREDVIGSTYELLNRRFHIVFSLFTKQFVSFVRWQSLAFGISESRACIEMPTTRALTKPYPPPERDLVRHWVVLTLEDPLTGSHGGRPSLTILQFISGAERERERLGNRLVIASSRQTTLGNKECSTAVRRRGDATKRAKASVWRVKMAAAGS